MFRRGPCCVCERTAYVLEKLDQDYSQGDNSQTARNIRRFKALIKDWNRKYRDILLEFSTDGIQCKLNVSFDDTMGSISAVIQKMNRFIEISTIGQRINAVFSELGKSGENTLTFESSGRLVRLVYSKEDMLRPGSPEFRICAYYALKNGFDKSIRIIESYKETFSFGDQTENYGWNSRWNVKFLR